MTWGLPRQTPGEEALVRITVTRHSVGSKSASPSPSALPTDRRCRGPSSPSSSPTGPRRSARIAYHCGRASWTRNVVRPALGPEWAGWPGSLRVQEAKARWSSTLDRCPAPGCSWKRNRFSGMASFGAWIDVALRSRTAFLAFTASKKATTASVGVRKWSPRSFTGVCGGRLGSSGGLGFLAEGAKAAFLQATPRARSHVLRVFS